MADAQHGPKKIIEKLHEACGESVAASFDPQYNSFNGASYGLATDFDSWIAVLSNLKECDLYRTAASEYLSSFLSICQGKHRDAFKGLRLVLELTLQGVHLSASLVPLREWLSNQADTDWRSIVDENNGVFAKKFCRAFFEALTDEIGAFRTLAETLYREMSECTHGNVPHRIPLPTKIAFDEAAFHLWHEKASSLRLLVNFALSMRYLLQLESAQRDQIEAVLSSQLGHLSAIRTVFGGQP